MTDDLKQRLLSGEPYDALVKEAVRKRIEQLEAECDELKADAMRYRWLCHRNASKDFAICEWVDEAAEWYALGMSKKDVDAILGAAIAATEPKP